MKKLGFIFVFTLAVSPLCAQNAQSQDDYYTGYEGVVLGERAPRSATDAIAEQATQVPGDIYRGTLFGAEQKKYEGNTLGNRPRATTKYVYDTSLVRAIKISDTDRVRTLMYANVNVNEKNYAGITPLTIAAEKGNMEIIKMLVEDGKAVVNDPSSYGVTPLIAAAAAGNDKVVEYLIAQGADVTAKDDLGKTALIYAIGFDNPKLISSLIKLDNKAVNLPDNSGNTPLIYATQKGLVNNIKLLLANGAKVDYRNPATGLCALSAAAAEDQSAAIRLLVRTGKADVNLPDLSGRTPIFYAVEQDKADALRTLISLGADVNAQDNNGVTPLMRASAKNRQDCVNILLKQKNINTNLKDFQGRTAITYSVYAEEVAPAQALLKAGADINTRDSASNTPLMGAVKAKNDRMALFLIQQGADLTAANAAGENVFTLTDEYLPQSMTANVLGVKKAEAYQQALQIQAEKLADVRTLEQQLADEEAVVQQLKDEQEARARAEAEAEAAALRAQIEQEYQAKAAEQMQNDPELIRLQQQLEAAKAQKEAALQEEIDRQVAAKLGKDAPEAPSVLAEEAAAVQAQAEAAKQQAVKKAADIKAQAKTSAAKQRAAATKKKTAVKTAANKTTAAAKQTVQAATAVPQEINMADIL
ncbi:ankyrin repeat domain-containing protein [Candidatus Avelusimicrobium alvi]|uniref:ankyrin repeat domain-containing protein n=1 Tax=Candidatus Avelusimicrobium alvi TaxID=3416221 RepID=UPI003D1259F3